MWEETERFVFLRGSSACFELKVVILRAFIVSVCGFVADGVLRFLMDSVFSPDRALDLR